jgi:hypothetical protein
MTYLLHKVIKFIFHVKIQLFVTAKSEQDTDPDPRRSVLVWLSGSSALR